MSDYKDFELDITSPATNDSVAPRATAAICAISIAACQITMDICVPISLDWCTMAFSCDGRCTGNCTVTCGPQCTNTCGC